MPRPGAALCRARIASLPLSAGPPPLRQPHVDDRHIEAADVADQIQALLAGCGLMDLEPIPQHPAHSEPDEWVTVDHKAVWALAQDCFRSALGSGVGSGSTRVLGDRS